MRLFIPLCFSSLLLFGQTPYADLVNPFVGTDGHGHTFPGATTPFGMVQLSPDTRVEGWDACGGYHYSDSTILGFTHTHLSGTGVPDYGDILFMPMSKQPSLRSNSYRSSFSHQNEKASAGYYQVFLQDDSINVELTTTLRAGIHRYKFAKGDSAYVIIDLHHGLGPDVVIDSWMQKNGRTEISGFRRSKGWAQDQHLYFVAQFSLPIQNISVTNNDSVVWNNTLAKGINVKGALLFNIKKNKELVVKVALSSVSVDGARKNLLTEAKEWNFETLLKQT